jgi:hypothetical protein
MTDKRTLIVGNWKTASETNRSGFSLRAGKMVHILSGCSFPAKQEAEV